MLLNISFNPEATSSHVSVRAFTYGTSRTRLNQAKTCVKCLKGI